MGWSIANVVNEVKISKQCAKDLFKAQKYEEEMNGMTKACSETIKAGL